MPQCKAQAGAAPAQRWGRARRQQFPLSFPPGATWRISPPTHCKAKLCTPSQQCCHCPRAKTEEQSGCCLKAERLSACETLVTRLQWAKSSSPLHIPLSKRGPPDKPCVLSSLLLVDTMAPNGPGDTGVFYPLPQPTAAPADSGSCSRSCAGVANPASSQHFLSSVSHSFLSPPQPGNP